MAPPGDHPLRIESTDECRVRIIESRGLKGVVPSELNYLLWFQFYGIPWVRIIGVSFLLIFNMIYKFVRNHENSHMRAFRNFTCLMSI